MNKLQQLDRRVDEKIDEYAKAYANKDFGTMQMAKQDISRLQAAIKNTNRHYLSGLFGF